jgi:hypothetical protein
VTVRVIVFVLAVLVAAGVTSQASGASGTVMTAPDVAAAVDEAPDADPTITETAVVFEAPARCELRQFAASSGESNGRLHGISIFRPPRSVASR